MNIVIGVNGFEKVLDFVFLFRHDVFLVGFVFLISVFKYSRYQEWLGLCVMELHSLDFCETRIDSCHPFHAAFKRRRMSLF